MIPETKSSLNGPREVGSRVEVRHREQQLQDQILTLKSQLAVLHGVNQRLGQHLKEALDKLGVSPEQVVLQLETAEALLLRHEEAQLLPYLNPLLASYENRIQLQEQAITELKGVALEARRKAQLLGQDSRLFRQQLQKKNEYLISLCSGGHPDSGMADLYSKLNEEDKMLKTALVAKENEYLQKHVARLEAEGASSRQLYQEARRSAESLSRRNKQLAEDCKTQQLALQDSDKIKHILQKKLKEITQQNLRYEAQISQLQGKSQRNQNQAKLSRAQALSLKTSMAELEEKYSSRTAELEREIEDLKRSEKSLFMRNTDLERAGTEAGREQADLKQEVSTLKGEQQNMLTMLQNYEAKLSSLKRSQELTQAQLQASKQKEQQAVLDADKLELAVAERDQKMQLMTEGFRQEIEELKQSYQQIIRAQRKKERDVDEEGGEALRDKDKERAKRQRERERERAHREKERERLKTEERKKDEHAVGDKEMLLTVLREKQEFNEAVLRQKIQSLEEQNLQLEEQLKRLGLTKRELELEQGFKRGIAEQLENEVRSLRVKVAALMKQNEGLSAQLMLVRREGDSRASTVQAQLAGVIQGLEKRLGDSLRKEKLLREETIRKLRSYDEEEEQLRRHYEERIRQLQAEMTVLRRK